MAEGVREEFETMARWTEGKVGEATRDVAAAVEQFGDNASGAIKNLATKMDGVGGGPPPFSKADRSKFLQALDRVLVGMARG